MAITCPKCGGTHTQSIKAITQAGTTYSTGSMSGVGLGTDGAAVFTGSSSNTSQTGLAARFAPPKKPKKLESIAGGILALAATPWLFQQKPTHGDQPGAACLVGMGGPQLHEEEQALSGSLSHLEGHASAWVLLP